MNEENQNETKVKICGLCSMKDVESVIKSEADLAGMVLYYPKSKRNIQIAQAKHLIYELKKSDIKTVAVTVNPTNEQLQGIEAAGFDYFQVHGNLSDSVYDQSQIPLIRALNVKEDMDEEQIAGMVTEALKLKKAAYVLLDAGSPGEGKIFSWENIRCVLEKVEAVVHGDLSKRLIVAGGLNITNVSDAVRIFQPVAVDVSSGVEMPDGTGKDPELVYSFIRAVHNGSKIRKKLNMEERKMAGSKYYGEFGGQFVAESLMNTLQELEKAFDEAMADPEFIRQYHYYLKEYVGRETPLYYAERLSEKYGTKIYLKREDLNHTGAHKINNVIGQILLAKRMGKTKVIAETGAGQHGVATATGAALFNMECTVYMGAEDIERQQLNVFRMEMLGAKVESVTTGSATLKDATNEAIRTWAERAEDTFYVIGSAVGPHPYPKMVKAFQRIISTEAKKQILEKEGRLPDVVTACVGGGSNSIGMFADFIDEPSVKLVGVEAGGLGVETGKHASAMALGKPGVLHGMKTYLLQDDDGNIELAHSISAGLDYPGVGPEHAYLKKTGRAEYVSITDQEAMDALMELCRMEGIIPAIESAHALAHVFKMAKNMTKAQIIVMCLSGRGDKDVHTVEKYLNGEETNK